MSKRPLTRAQLLWVLVAALALLAWLLVHRIQREREAARFVQAPGRTGSPAAGEPAGGAPVVRLRVQRIAAEEPMYWLRVGEHAWEVSPPGGMSDRPAEDPWGPALARYAGDIRETLGAARKAHERPDEVVGEVHVPPEGAPHELVVRLLGLFAEAGYGEASFRVPEPPPSSER